MELLGNFHLVFDGGGDINRKSIGFPKLPLHILEPLGPALAGQALGLLKLLNVPERIGEAKPRLLQTADYDILCYALVERHIHEHLDLLLEVLLGVKQIRFQRPVFLENTLFVFRYLHFLFEAFVQDEGLRKEETFQDVVEYWAPLASVHRFVLGHIQEHRPQRFLHQRGIREMHYFTDKSCPRLYEFLSELDCMIYDCIHYWSVYLDDAGVPRIGLYQHLHGSSKIPNPSDCHPKLQQV